MSSDSPRLTAALSDRYAIERFVVEIKTTASLQHPHILPLFDSGTADGFLFYRDAVHHGRDDSREAHARDAMRRG